MIAKEGRIMNRVEGFNTYRNNYYEAPAAKREAAKTTEAKQTENTGTAQLSSGAKELLEELKEKYGNADFMVADYETDEEAASYLSRGTKEYSVLLEPETLEKMAEDQDVKTQYLDRLDESMSQLADMAGKLGDQKDEVSHIGVAIKDDGTTSYFAELDKVSEKQRERIEKNRETHKEEKVKEEKAREEKAKEAKEFDERKHTRVTADSVEELLEKIRNVNWDQVKAGQVPTAGSRFDYSI